MEKKLYYIECTCVRDVIFPNTEFKVGDVLYYNGNASSNEMWIFNNQAFLNADNLYLIEANDNIKRYKWLIGSSGSYLPFTRQKKNARKYKKLKQAEHIKSCIENRNDFKCEIKEIKLVYYEN